MTKEKDYFCGILDDGEDEPDIPFERWMFESVEEVRVWWANETYRQEQEG